MEEGCFVNASFESTSDNLCLSASRSNLGGVNPGFCSSFFFFVFGLLPQPQTDPMFYRIRCKTG